MIHPSAVVHPRAQLDPTVEVGPYAVIDEHVVLGSQCRVGPYVYLTGHTTIGARNQFFAGSVIGEAPQDLKYRGQPTRVRIGDDNVIRENVTVHRSATEDGETSIGSRNFLMAGSHVAHNCRLANEILLINGALLAGHVIVSDKALISGNSVVHQFCRIGTLSLIQGGTTITLDVAPYTLAYGINQACGLNIVGLRRAGFAPAARLELKRLYHALFHSGRAPRPAAEAAKASGEFPGPSSVTMLDFILGTSRGICQALNNGSRPIETETETETETPAPPRARGSRHPRLL